MLEMYGIPNCDTIRKARRWLADHALAFEFHNYKTEGVDAARLSGWVDHLGWEILLNKRGTTWRKLAEADKQGIDRDKAIALMCENPSMIKRPVLVQDDVIEVGFSVQRYEALFA